MGDDPSDLKIGMWRKRLRSNCQDSQEELSAEAEDDDEGEEGEEELSEDEPWGEGVYDSWDAWQENKIEEWAHEGRLDRSAYLGYLYGPLSMAPGYALDHSKDDFEIIVADLRQCFEMHHSPCVDKGSEEKLAEALDNLQSAVYPDICSLRRAAIDQPEAFSATLSNVVQDHWTQEFQMIHLATAPKDPRLLLELGRDIFQLIARHLTVEDFMALGCVSKQAQATFNSSSFSIVWRLFSDTARVPLFQETDPSDFEMYFQIDEAWAAKHNRAPFSLFACGHIAINKELDFCSQCVGDSFQSSVRARWKLENFLLKYCYISEQVDSGLEFYALILSPEALLYFNIHDGPPKARESKDGYNLLAYNLLEEWIWGSGENIPYCQGDFERAEHEYCKRTFEALMKEECKMNFSEKFDTNYSCFWSFGHLQDDGWFCGVMCNDYNQYCRDHSGDAVERLRKRRIRRARSNNWK